MINWAACYWDYIVFVFAPGLAILALYFGAWGVAEWLAAD